MKPVNGNATPEAVALLDYLYRTVEERKLITGQHTQTNPMEEIAYIYEVTGKRPKLQGFELLGYSPNINWEDADEACITEIKENQGTVETAIRWAKETKGIVSICFHWYSPVGGRDKSFYQKNTDFDARKVLEEGTEERKAFYSDMDVIADILRKFQDEKIPVLWRPFHEADGDCQHAGAEFIDSLRQLSALCRHFCAAGCVHVSDSAVRRFFRLYGYHVRLLRDARRPPDGEFQPAVLCQIRVGILAQMAYFARPVVQEIRVFSYRRIFVESEAGQVLPRRAG